jgi:hypothetical protein
MLSQSEESRLASKSMEPSIRNSPGTGIPEPFHHALVTPDFIPDLSQQRAIPHQVTESRPGFDEFHHAVDFTPGCVPSVWPREEVF